MVILVSFSQYKDTDGDFWGRDTREGYCQFRINKTTSVNYTDNGFSFQFEGVLEKTALAKSLKYTYKGKYDPDTLLFSRVNANLTAKNPTDTIHSLCASDFFPKNANCRSKAYYCRNSIDTLAQESIQYLQDFQADWKNSSLINVGNRVLGCRRPDEIDLRFDDDYKTFMCLTYNTYDEKFCSMTINCVITALEMAVQYEKDIQNCQREAEPYQYGIAFRAPFFNWQRSFEYVSTKSERDFPRYVVRKCANEYGKITLRTTSLNESHYLLECWRLGRDTIRLMTLVPTCHQFVEKCKKMIQCAEESRLCVDEVLGQETIHGFEMKLGDGAWRLDDCYHWGVRLVKKGISVYCEAIGTFQFEGQSFCESYGTVCRQLGRCLKMANCINNQTQTPIFADTLKSVGFDYPPPIRVGPWADPRDLLPTVYLCNKQHGYPHKIHFYFLRVGCYTKNCTIIRSDSAEEQIHWISGNAYQRPYMSAPQDDSPRDMFWYCQRDLFSEASCQEFDEICRRISDCISKEGMRNLTEEESEAVMDGQCYSPLPLHPDFPIIQFARGRSGTEHGLYTGEIVSMVLPLDESLIPTYLPLDYHLKSGPGYFSWLNRLYSSRFFYDRFIEDCKHAYDFFQSDLVEPFFVDRVKFLICALPMGGARDKVNPTIERGCGHIKSACINMKKCYQRFRRHFTFTTYFQQ